MSKRDLQSIINAGIKAAENSDGRYRHGCVVFTNKCHIVCVGSNRHIKDGESIHAEEMALTKIPPQYDRRKLYIYVCRVNGQGLLRYSKPCSRVCERLIKLSGIPEKNVIHS